MLTSSRVSGGSDGDLPRPSVRAFTRHLPTLPRRRPSLASRRSSGAPAPFYEHLGGYAMHELRDFNRHPRWHDDQWRVPPIVTCRLHGNSVLTETRDGSVFITMLWFRLISSIYSMSLMPDNFFRLIRRAFVSFGTCLQKLSNNFKKNIQPHSWRCCDFARFYLLRTRASRKTADKILTGHLAKMNIILHFLLLHLHHTTFASSNYRVSSYCAACHRKSC